MGQIRCLIVDEMSKKWDPKLLVASKPATMVMGRCARVANANCSNRLSAKFKLWPKPRVLLACSSQLAAYS